MKNIDKADIFSPLFILNGNQLSVLPGTIYAGHAMPEEVALPKKLKPGTDYAIAVEDGKALGASIDYTPDASFIGGFHVGLDGQIVERSIWDCKFRPKALDPRGMILIGDFWADIYLLNVDPRKNGTSAACREIATGTHKIALRGGLEPLTWWSAVAALAGDGKQLLSMAEFSVATMGVTEGKTAGEKPETTCHIKGLKSSYGLEQATGCMWTWGRDFDPSGGWPVVMGGDWYSDAAGPRRFSYDHPVYGGSDVGARGRCDHLILA